VSYFRALLDSFASPKIERHPRNADGEIEVDHGPDKDVRICDESKFEDEDRVVRLVSKEAWDAQTGRGVSDGVPVKDKRMCWQGCGRFAEPRARFELCSKCIRMCSECADQMLRDLAEFPTAMAGWVQIPKGGER